MGKNSSGQFFAPLWPNLGPIKMLPHPKSRSLSSNSFSSDLAKLRPKKMKHLDNMAKSCIFSLFAPFWPKLDPIFDFPVPPHLYQNMHNHGIQLSGKKSANSNVVFKKVMFKKVQFGPIFAPFGPKKWKMGMFIKNPKTLLSYHFRSSTSCPISVKNNEWFRTDMNS